MHHEDMNEADKKLSLALMELVNSEEGDLFYAEDVILGPGATRWGNVRIVLKGKRPRAGELLVEMLNEHNRSLRLSN